MPLDSVHPQLMLASQSPRRRELLDQLGLRYALYNPDLDESRHEGEGPLEYVARISREKAAAGQAHGKPGHRPVLGADTAVVLNGTPFGKPRDVGHAQAMLRQLSGNTHQVVSGIALHLPDGQLLAAMNITDVTFRRLDETEIGSYCSGPEPMDKAGAYAIQGMAACFIETIKGSYSGVMGLPLFETAQLLNQAGIRIPPQQSLPATPDGG